MPNNYISIKRSDLMSTKSRITVLLQAIIIAGISILTLRPAISQEIVEGASKSQTNLRRFVPTTVSDGWQVGSPSGGIGGGAGQVVTLYPSLSEPVFRRILAISSTTSSTASWI